MINGLILYNYCAFTYFMKKSLNITNYKVSDGLDTMSKQIKTADEAVEYKLTDSDIERAELLLGIDLASRMREHHACVSTDGIRNFAVGNGDDNPLFCDPQYAAGSRWGGSIAPNCMLQMCNMPMLGDPLSPELKKQTRGLFKGVHNFVSGGQWEWYRPAYAGDTVYSFDGEESQEVKPSKFAGRSLTRITRRVKMNQRGEILGVYRVRTVYAERSATVKNKKNATIEPTYYTDEDIAEIDAIYASETIRGPDLRYWEDVEVGDEVGPMVKGPLTVTDMIAFAGGGYGFGFFKPLPGRVGYKNRQKIGTFYIKNKYGIPDVSQRVHWDNDWARSVGHPMAYDYGVMRECWLYHMISDWMGDDAFVIKQYDEIRKFNYVGDTQFLRGEVINRYKRNGLYLVDIDVSMKNQHDEQTVKGDFTVALPSRDAGPVVLPLPSQDLQRKAHAMMQRHYELTLEKQNEG